jgi:hypothetical protein
MGQDVAMPVGTFNPLIANALAAPPVRRKKKHLIYGR